MKLFTSYEAGAVSTLGLVIVLLSVELLAISLFYQHGFDFTCRDAAPVWFCAFAGRIIPRVLGILAVLMIFIMTWRDSIADLLANTGARTSGFVMNLLGFALVLIPWFGLSDSSSSLMVTAAAVSWLFGGILTMIGLALVLAPWGVWRKFLAENGLILTVLMAVALILPELADQLQPLWRIEAVTEVTFFATLWVLGALGYVVTAVPADKIIGVDEFFVAVGPQCSGVEGFVLITVFLALYVGLFRRELRFPQALLLFPVGLALGV